MIETSGLVKLYGMHAALRGVTLEVPAGEILTVLGHNGSGKTTLVRLLATLARPSAGHGRIAGHDLIAGRDQVRRLVAVVGHSTHLYDDLTPRENLAFAEALAGRRSDPARIDAALAQVGIEGQAGTRVRELSSGLRRRVALARAMLREPGRPAARRGLLGARSGQHEAARGLPPRLQGRRRRRAGRDPQPRKRPHHRRSRGDPRWRPYRGRGGPREPHRGGPPASLPRCHGPGA